MDTQSMERFRRADAVFDAALDLPPDRRAAFVQEACAGDAALGDAVHRLLRAYAQSDGFLTSSAAAIAAPLLAQASSETDAAATPVPERIGPYRIEREIGRGGMGIVYLAERDDPTFRQRVALKVVRAGGPDDSKAHVARFLSERQLLASLEHAHIARLFDGGVTNDGLPYYTMAYCEGGSLADRLRENRTVPVHEALPIARQLAMALGAAHARGVVHRDVKPGNVLFDTDGSLRLTDFGIAKLLGGDLTRTGGVLGTPAYLSPEQVTGEAVDHRADLWALGVTLYEMLAGRRPFDGSSYASVLHRIVTTTPDPLQTHVPGMTGAVEGLVTWLLQKDPAQRPPTADHVIRVLDDMARGVDATPARQTRRRHRVLAISGVVFSAVLGYGAWKAIVGRESAKPAVAATPVSAPPSLAVLPFANTSGNVADEPFTDGLTDELIGTLGRVMRVTARSSAFALKGLNLSSHTIGDTLGVDYLLEGSARVSGAKVRVFAQLVRARTDSVLWSDQYDREQKDMFTVQREIAQAIASALSVPLALGDDVSRTSGDSAARDLYRKGRFAMYTRTGPSDLDRAVRLFEAAIARDSSFARAYAGLSDAYTSMGNFAYGGRPGEVFAKARANARRALALDSTLAEARTSLAHVLCVYDLQWDAADREFRRAIADDPGYPFARMAYAVCVMSRGRYDEAIAQLDTAYQRDPLRFGIGSLRGRVYVNAGRADEAIAALTETLDINPQADLAWQQLGEAYLLKGRSADAIASFRKAALLSGVRDSAQLAYAFATTGDRATAARILNDIVASTSARYVPPYHVAMAYAGLGDVDEAFKWLYRAYDERASFIGGVKVTRAFAPLHRDPRWARLLVKMGLEP